MKRMLPIFETSLAFSVFRIFYRFHNLRLNRHVSEVCLAGRDFVNNLHTFYHFTESSISAVQMWSILVHNKELRAGRIGIHGTLPWK